MPSAGEPTAEGVIVVKGEMVGAGNRCVLDRLGPTFSCRSIARLLISAWLVPAVLMAAAGAVWLGSGGGAASAAGEPATALNPSGVLVVARVVVLVMAGPTVLMATIWAVRSQSLLPGLAGADGGAISGRAHGGAAVVAALCGGAAVFVTSNTVAAALIAVAAVGAFVAALVLPRLLARAQSGMASPLALFTVVLVAEVTLGSLPWFGGGHWWSAPVAMVAIGRGLLLGATALSAVDSLRDDRLPVSGADRAVPNRSFSPMVTAWQWSGFPGLRSTRFR